MTTLATKLTQHGKTKTCFRSIYREIYFHFALKIKTTVLVLLASDLQYYLIASDLQYYLIASDLRIYMELYGFIREF
jgi:hypothetical protein